MKSDEKLIKTFVPLVRSLVRNGLSESFIKGCVRIGEVIPYTGGLKSNFVGHVRIDVNTVIKTHTDELLLHKTLMENVNNYPDKPKVFPEILDLVELENNLYIMLMEELLKYQTFLHFIYNKNLNKKQLEYLTKKSLELISVIHNSKIESFASFPVNENPYFERIKNKVEQILKIDEDLKKLKTKKWLINNKEILPISTIIKNLKTWLDKDLSDNNLKLVHGDFHLGNILFRPRGKGFSCLTIDPNPLIGISDSLYDFGKFLHWVDIVGWAKEKPEKCKSDFKIKKNNYRLNYWLENEPKSVKNRRSIVNKAILTHLNNISDQFNGNWGNRLKISLASAHLGLASIYSKPQETEVRRFIFARAIELLNDVMKY